MLIFIGLQMLKAKSNTFTHDTEQTPIMMPEGGLFIAVKNKVTHK